MTLPDPALFPKGTILNTYGGGATNPLRNIVYAQIRRYQTRKYPHSARTDAVHTMIHLGGGDYLSVEHPRAIVKKPDLRPGERCSFWQYKYLDRFDGAAWVAFDEAAGEIEGTRYDYGQLLDILVHQLFGWLPDKLSIFDFSRKRKVCSVAAHALLVKAWQATAAELPRPLGDQYVEHTCPADFENHGTFVRVSPGNFSQNRPLSPALSQGHPLSPALSQGHPLSPALSPQSREREAEQIRAVAQ